MNKTEHIYKLPNSPLQEAIFELLLEDEVDTNGNPTEEKYQLAQGIFAREISKKFPKRITKKFPDSIRIFPRIVHQFWTESQKWPVIQLGPGILTVNDTDENYMWTKFSPLIKETINQLEESYDEELKIQQVSLRYLDAVELNNKETKSKLDFINEKFKLKLIPEFGIENSQLIGININQSYLLNNKSIVNFSISDGRSKKNLPAIVWQSHIKCPSVSDKREVFEWIEQAHSVVSKLFKDTVSKEFYEQFK